MADGKGGYIFGGIFAIIAAIIGVFNYDLNKSSVNAEDYEQLSFQYQQLLVQNGELQSQRLDLESEITMLKSIINEQNLNPDPKSKVNNDSTIDNINISSIDEKPNTTRKNVKLSDLEYFTREGADFTYEEQLRANTGDYFNDCYHTHHNGGTMDYLLNGQFTTIIGTIFLSYDRRAEGDAAKFNIWGDNKLLYSSDEIKSGTMPLDFEVDISNTDVLKIGLERTGSGWIDGIAVSDITLYKK